jgi:uncharacterized membrane protein (UPF0127 family)
MNKFKLIVAILIAIFITILIFANFQIGQISQNKTKKLEEIYYVKVISKENSIEKATFDVSIADTPDERMLGLMFVKSMPENKGMYFIFDEVNDSGFWMKNCEIPLDIIYIGSANEIVDISENAQPCRTANCEVFKPSTKYQYVLEIKGGLSQKLNIKIGDSVLLRN